MDFIQVTIHAVCKYWYLLLIPVLPVLIKIPQLRSCINDPIVSFFTCMMLNKKKYHRINNVIIPIEKVAALIDYIIVSVYGVFIIKTMDLSGSIYGGPDLNTWILKTGKHTDSFQNPVYHNYKSVKALQSMLGLKDNQIHSIVVFTGKSIFKTDMPANITKGLGFIRFIKSKKVRVLSEFDVMEIKLKIIDAMLDQSLSADIKNVGNNTETEDNRRTPACPL